MRALTLVQVRQSHAAARPARAAGHELAGGDDQDRAHPPDPRHLASQGHGIVGDDKYGDFALNKRLPKQGLGRMFLHAWRLRLNHPVTGESLTLLAALPPELAQFLEAGQCNNRPPPHTAEQPLPSECCDSGCSPCVWDLTARSWPTTARNWPTGQARHPEEK